MLLYRRKMKGTTRRLGNCLEASGSHTFQQHAPYRFKQPPENRFQETEQAAEFRIYSQGRTHELNVVFLDLRLTVVQTSRDAASGREPGMPNSLHLLKQMWRSRTKGNETGRLHVPMHRLLSFNY